MHTQTDTRKKPCNQVWFEVRLSNDWFDRELILHDNMYEINANGQLVCEQYLYQMMTSKSNIRAMQWFDAATSTFDVNCSCGSEYPNNLYYTFLALLQLIHVNWPNSIILFTFTNYDRKCLQSFDSTLKNVKRILSKQNVRVQ